MLADVLKKCIKIYGLDPSHILSASVAWQACFKKTEVVLELLTYINMLLMIKAGIREGMYQAVYKYAKANNKFMAYYDKNIEWSYLMYLDASNLYGWAMSQKLFVNGFRFENNLSRFNENFIKNYSEESVGEVGVEYPKEFFSSHKELLFLPERKKKKK